MRRWILPVILLGIVCGNAYALVDVTSQVEIIRTSPVYDSDTGQTYVDVTLRNISAEGLELPIRLVFTSLIKGNVTIPNPDGTDENGNPYYLFFSPNQTNLAPGDIVGPKRIYFNNIMLGICMKTRIKKYCSKLKENNMGVCVQEQHNYCFSLYDPLKAGFSFAWHVQLSTSQETINNFVSTLETDDFASAINIFSPLTKDKYKEIIQNIYNQGKLGELANELKGAFIIETNGIKSKYGIIRVENGKHFLYEIYMYKDTNGVWRIIDL